MTPGSGSTFGALRHPQFRLLWSGLMAGNVGIWMENFAIGWLVVQMAVAEGNPERGGLYLGLRSLASAAPALGFGLLAGVFADRMDRRTLLMRTRIASGTVAAVLAAAVITGHANLLIVMLLSAAEAATFAFDPPGRQATVPNVVPRRDLFSATGLMRASMQTAHTVGPLVAGILMIPLGVAGVLLAKVGLDLASIGVLAPLRPQRPEQGSRSLGILDSFRQGLSHIRRDELILWTLALQTVFAVFGFAFVQLLPAVAVDTLDVGAVELSWLLGANGLGALLAAFFIASAGRIERRGLLLLGALGAIGALNIALGAQRELVGAILVVALLGFVQQSYMGTQTVILQLASPDAMRGRVMSLQSTIMNGFGPVGVLVIGTLGAFIGVSTAILVAGVAVACATVAATARLTLIRELRASADEGERRIEALAQIPAAEGTD